MDVNKFKVSGIFYFKSGNSKKIDWIEDRLVKRETVDGEEVTSNLRLKEVDTFFQGKFKEWKDNGSTIVRKNVNGYNSIIPFLEVEYATVIVEEIKDYNNPKGEDKPELEVVDHNMPVPPPPTQQFSRIADHPAFKK
ncbi:hypothetical protein [Metabacillus fastidiosus]|uniref:hypothetical protein n=1 Tax=Metabacillus fastidiosus TaxID=1458 RepID=UPI003D26A14A